VFVKSIEESYRSLKKWMELLVIIDTKEQGERKENEN